MEKYVSSLLQLDQTNSYLVDLNIEHVKNAFEKYDKKSDGNIKPEYLCKVLRKVGLNPTENQVDTFLNEILVDGKRKVSFADCLQCVVTLSSDPDTLIAEVFNLFDTDGSGTICSEEFYAQVMRCGAALTKEEVKELIKTADKNGDGVLDIQELSALLRSGSKEDLDKD